MPVRQFDGLLSYLRRLVYPQTVGGELTDGQLIERYVTEYDELAFGSLVRRHGPLVFGVGRRILLNDHDAEDVFQATFVMLARKAADEKWRDSVAGWLYRVAFRLATRMRAQTVRQRALEQVSRDTASRTTTADLQTLFAILDQELHRLSTSYRDPLLLCYLQGRTRDQAARQLGWSLRTVERRLEQGLKLLRDRLSKRGVELPMTLLAAGLSQQAAEAGVTSSLIVSTVEVAGLLNTGGAMVNGAMAKNVLQLVEGGLKAMAIEKAKFGLGVLLTGLALAVGASAIGYQVLAAKPDPQTPAPEPQVVDVKQPSVWPEGATVTGKVVDHKGVAVADAEILMLGEERIIVEADRRTWFEFPKPDGLPLPSTRTNKQGEFSISRKKGSANRLVVISRDPLLWAVYKKNLPRDNDLEIKLPTPGSLVIHTDLPGKPPTQTVLINYESLEGGEWHNEILRFHFDVVALKNPGDTLVEHLPPGTFVIERVFKTPTNADGSLLNMADRQLVTIIAGKQSSIRFERKTGRPLEGRILGLEKTELRHARVTIMYAGPETQVESDGRRTRIFTTFDNLPISPDGRFTTDPIPPGEYLLDLYALRSTTPEQSNQSSDFRAQKTFTIPEKGEMPKLEVIAKPTSDKERSPNTDARINIVDAKGNPVQKAQAMAHSTNNGYTAWKQGRGGVATIGDSLGPKQASTFDVIVRADGYASAVKRIEGADHQLMKDGKYTLALQKGQKVELRLQLPEGQTWSKGVSPEAYFVDYEDRVKTMRQPSNRQPRRDHTPAIDFNMLNLHESAPGRFEAQLTDSTPPFYVGIHSPGFLQHFDAGPFTQASAHDGIIGIPVPRPAQLDVRFDAGRHNAESLPYQGVYFVVYRQLEGDSMLEVATGTADGIKGELKLTDLAPGNYIVNVATKSKQTSPSTSSTEINKGAFRDQKHVTLKAGARETVHSEYVPFGPDAFKGTRSALLRFRTADGKPMANKLVKVEYYDGHYGNLVAYTGMLPPSGELELQGVTDRISYPKADLLYQVYVDDRRLGHFGFTKPHAKPTFDFQLAPEIGDVAPDVELVNVATGKPIRLSSLRGKVVCLDFWASWCGPCRPTMAKLNALNQQRGEQWKDRVAIIPVSIDNNLERARLFVEQAGWNKLSNCWTGTEGAVGFEAPAVKAFQIQGVPETILIGPDGRLLWRGHPLNPNGGQSLESRIEAASLK